MRLLVPIVVMAANIAGCDAPEPADGNSAPAENALALPGSSSGDPGAATENAISAPAKAEPQLAQAIPKPFHGTYDESSDACGRPSEYRLVVTDKELRFHESIGSVRSVAVEGPRSASVTADYQGEGESWSNSRQLRLSDDGSALTIEGEGTTLKRVRCP